MDEAIREVTTAVVIIFGSLITAYTIMEIPLNLVKLTEIPKMNGKKID